MGLTPSRVALRSQPSAVQIRSRRICRTVWILILSPSPPIIKNAHEGRFYSVERVGLFGPSMGPTPSRVALRGQPSAVQIRSRRICRTVWILILSPSPPVIKNAHEGRFYSVERVGLFGPSMGLTPSRVALRGQPSAVQIRSRRICRTVWILILSPSPPVIKKRPRGAFFYDWRRGWDSNPRYAYTYA